MVFEEIGPDTDIQAVLNFLIQNLQLLTYEQGLDLILRRPTIISDLKELRQEVLDNTKKLRILNKTIRWLTRSLTLSKIAENPANIENAPIDVFDSKDNGTDKFLSTIVRRHPSIFNQFDSRDSPVRKSLLKAFSDQEIEVLVAEEIINNPCYIFNFYQHELPKEWIAAAIEREPRLIANFPDYSFVITTDLWEVFAKAGFPYMNEIVSKAPGIFRDLSVDSNIRERLLKTLSDPDVYDSVLNEILRDPEYIFEFAQHEIPESWVAQAIEKNPSLIGDFWDNSFKITEGLCEVFRKNWRYIKYVHSDLDCPYLAYKYAIDRNIYALFYAPDDVVTRYFEESFEGEQR